MINIIESPFAAVGPRIRAAKEARDPTRQEPGGRPRSGRLMA